MPDLHEIEQATGERLEAGRAFDEATGRDPARIIDMAYAALAERDALLISQARELFALRCVYRELTGKAWKSERADKAEGELSTLKAVETSLRDDLAANREDLQIMIEEWDKIRADLAAMTKERDRWEMIARGMAEIYSEPGDCGEENLVNLLEADEAKLARYQPAEEPDPPGKRERNIPYQPAPGGES